MTEYKLEREIVRDIVIEHFRSDEGRAVLKRIVNRFIDDYLVEHPGITRDQVIEKLKLSL